MDVLSVDWHDLTRGRNGPLIVVGNLPYNITSQILFGLLEAGCVSRAVLTMQKEVAQRLVASPRTKEYGILSVIVQLLTVPSIRFHLSPNVFYPKPEVWSSTVRLDWSAERAAPAPSDPAFLRQLVRAAFNQRRKVLRNSLSMLGTERGFQLPDRVAAKRAEELSPLEFLQLAEELLAESR
jgi:16S rRNA (adenine1518-N6/adenine1519-N6)-dimethyltransferase